MNIEEVVKAITNRQIIVAWLKQKIDHLYSNSMTYRKFYEMEINIPHAKPLISGSYWLLQVKRL